MTTAFRASPYQRLKALIIGNPLPSHEMAHQTISKKVGLAVFASDALSSTAYATEAILEVLGAAVPLAGIAGLGWSLPISFALVFLLAGVTQIASAFPTLHPWRVEIAVGIVMFMMIVNLRGVKESGVAFSIPTYFF